MVLGERARRGAERVRRGPGVADAEAAGPGALCELGLREVGESLRRVLFEGAVGELLVSGGQYEIVGQFTLEDEKMKVR
jgi:hypothetical protein